MLPKKRDFGREKERFGFWMKGSVLVVVEMKNGKGVVDEDKEESFGEEKNNCADSIYISIFLRIKGIQKMVEMKIYV